MPKHYLLAAIHHGRSIALCFPEHKIISSALVGGIAPIAMGIAWAIKRQGGKEKVWVFVGDMTAEGGLYHECLKYSHCQNLPIEFVIEDNGLSVCTDTLEAWGIKYAGDVKQRTYEYKLTYPHVGIGKFVRF